MKTEIRKFVAAISALGQLASCAQLDPLDARNASATPPAQNTRTLAEHDNIARRYENTSKELLVKAQEHKKLLEHYEDKSYLYGKQGQDFQSHKIALVRKYTLAAEKAATEAAFHYRMASELAKRGYAAFREPPHH